MAITNIDGKIYLALLERLEGMTGVPMIAEPGETFTPDVDNPHLVVNDVRSDFPRMYTGSTSEDEWRGMFIVDVMVPLSWTNAQLLGLTGKIKARFPKDTKITKVDANVFVIDTPSNQGAADRVGAFNRIPVKISWRCSG